MKKNLLQSFYAHKQGDLTHLLRVMKLSIILIFTFVFSIYAESQDSHNAIISIRKNTMTLREFITEVERQTNYLFVFSDSEVDVNHQLNVRVKNSNILEVLDGALKNADLYYVISDDYISIHKRSKTLKEQSPLNLLQQKKIKVTGTVVDQSNVPIIGANIILKGSPSIGAVTDVNGFFSIEVPANSNLLISYIGYKEQSVYIKGNDQVVNIQLTEDSETLDEVVVTALGIKREEKALGYAVQKVGGEKLITVKPVDVATSLTGKIAGLNVKNSTEFNEAPSLLLRGESPLLVIDGVPYRNLSLRDIAPDDIESVDVLKGATASALYGARGGSGAVMVTTKRGAQEGLHVTVNSSTMFDAGYLKRPEVQTSYSSGGGGRYGVGDYVWGDKLDIGRTAVQYNPFTYEWEEQPLVSKGKNNLKNFSELSLTTNNNISISQKGKYGSVRSSLTHVYNKGQFPNNKLNKFTYSVSGEMKVDKFGFEGGVTYNKRFYPNNFGTGYGGGGLLYNLLVWSGSEFDIRDYKNYWIKKDEQQNWMDKNWYDNPYFISNEIIHKNDYDVVNAFANASYDLKSWLKLSLRAGLDSYSSKNEWRNPVSAVGGWHKKGFYSMNREGGFSMNNDALLMANHTFGNFSIDGFVGGTLYFYQNDVISSETQNGLSIPGYYSLNASIDPAKTRKSFNRKQVNSLYGKASASWKSTVFVDVTARNDWSSTLPEETRSYFYPSLAGSIILSQFIPMPKVVDFWKIRASWTQTKNDLSVYETNKAYTISTNVWDGMNAAYYPGTMRGVLVEPSASRSYEIGTAFNLLSNRLKFDLTYYNKLNYNLTRQAGVSPTSGFRNTLINIDEENVRKGVEVTISGEVIKTKDFTWSSTFNWALDRYHYAKIDPTYSTKRPWVKAGERWDWLGAYDWERDPEGNIIHANGLPVVSNYLSVQGFTEPDWIWGFSNTLRYKSFTLNFSIDGRVGGVAHSVTDQAMWNSGSHIESDNQWRYEEVVNGNKTYVGNGVKIVSGSVDRDSDGNIIRDDRVFAPNDKVVSYETYMLKMNPYIGSVRTQNIFDQTFFKLRDLSVTYSLPKGICEKVRLKGATLGLVGQNLFIWTKEFKYSDPDKASENLNSPSLRYLGFNVKLDL